MHAWHLYPIRVADRDDLMSELRAEGIGVGIHYPVPLPFVGAFADYGHRRGEFPRAEEAADRLLSLPMHPHLQPAQQERIAALCAAFVA